MLAAPHRSLLRLARAHRGMSRRAEQILGVPAGASRAVLRERYYQLAKETHPDTATGRSPTAFKVVSARALSGPVHVRVSSLPPSLPTNQLPHTHNRPLAIE